jgi:DNA-binding CsgD family transcriptional regulator
MERRPTRPLTARQEAVLDLVASGHGNKQIASRLGISEQRVKEHVSTLLRLFDVPNRAGLAEAASRRRLVGTFDVDPEWLRFLFHDAPMYIAVLSGADYRLTAVNEAFRTTLQQPDIVGMTYCEAFPSRRDSLEILDEAYRTGRTIARSDLPRRFIRRPGGEPEDGYISTWVQPLPDATGAIAGLVIFATDTTDFVLARQRRRELEDELDTAHGANRRDTGLAD